MKIFIVVGEGGGERSFHPPLSSATVEMVTISEIQRTKVHSMTRSFSEPVSASSSSSSFEIIASASFPDISPVEIYSSPSSSLFELSLPNPIADDERWRFHQQQSKIFSSFSSLGENLQFAITFSSGEKLELMVDSSLLLLRGKNPQKINNNPILGIATTFPTSCSSSSGLEIYQVFVRYWLQQAKKEKKAKFDPDFLFQCAKENQLIRPFLAKFLPSDDSWRKAGIGALLKIITTTCEGDFDANSLLLILVLLGQFLSSSKTPQTLFQMQQQQQQATTSTPITTQQQLLLTTTTTREDEALKEFSLEFPSLLSASWTNQLILPLGIASFHDHVFFSQLEDWVKKRGDENGSQTGRRTLKRDDAEGGEGEEDEVEKEKQRQLFREEQKKKIRWWEKGYEYVWANIRESLKVFLALEDLEAQVPTMHIRLLAIKYLRSFGLLPRGFQGPEKYVAFGRRLLVPRQAERDGNREGCALSSQVQDLGRRLLSFHHQGNLLGFGGHNLKYKSILTEIQKLDLFVSWVRSFLQVASLETTLIIENRIEKLMSQSNNEPASFAHLQEALMLLKDRLLQEQIPRVENEKLSERLDPLISKINDDLFSLPRLELSMKERMDRASKRGDHHSSAVSYVPDQPISFDASVYQLNSFLGVRGVRGVVDDCDLTSARLCAPQCAIELRDGSILISELESSTLRICSPEGQVKILVGAAGPGYCDGPLSKARLCRPRGMWLCRDGSVLIADSGNHRIRRLVLSEGGSSLLKTVAGSGVEGLVDGDVREVAFAFPYAVAELDNGLIAVVDKGNHRIRFVYPLERRVGTSNIECRNPTWICPCQGEGEKDSSFFLCEEGEDRCSIRKCSSSSSDAEPLVVYRGEDEEEEGNDALSLRKPSSMLLEAKTLLVADRSVNCLFAINLESSPSPAPRPIVGEKVNGIKLFSPVGMVRRRETDGKILICESSGHMVRRLSQKESPKLAAAVELMQIIAARLQQRAYISFLQTLEVSVSIAKQQTQQVQNSITTILDTLKRGRLLISEARRILCISPFSQILTLSSFPDDCVYYSVLDAFVMAAPSMGSFLGIFSRLVSSRLAPQVIDLFVSKLASYPWPLDIPKQREELNLLCTFLHSSSSSSSSLKQLDVLDAVFRSTSFLLRVDSSTLNLMEICCPSEIIFSDLFHPCSIPSFNAARRAIGQWLCRNYGERQNIIILSQSESEAEESESNDGGSISLPLLFAGWKADIDEMEKHSPQGKIKIEQLIALHLTVIAQECDESNNMNIFLRGLSQLQAASVNFRIEQVRAFLKVCEEYCNFKMGGKGRSEIFALNNLCSGLFVVVERNSHQKLDAFLFEKISSSTTDVALLWSLMFFLSRYATTTESKAIDLPFRKLFSSQEKIVFSCIHTLIYQALRARKSALEEETKTSPWLSKDSWEEIWNRFEAVSLPIVSTFENLASALFALEETSPSPSNNYHLTVGLLKTMTTSTQEFSNFDSVPNLVAKAIHSSVVEKSEKFILDTLFRENDKCDDLYAKFAAIKAVSDSCFADTHLSAALGVYDLSWERLRIVDAKKLVEIGIGGGGIADDDDEENVQEDAVVIPSIVLHSYHWLAFTLSSTLFMRILQAELLKKQGESEMNTVTDALESATSLWHLLFQAFFLDESRVTCSQLAFVTNEIASLTRTNSSSLSSASLSEIDENDLCILYQTGEHCCETAERWSLHEATQESATKLTLVYNSIVVRFLKAAHLVRKFNESPSSSSSSFRAMLETIRPFIRGNGGSAAFAAEFESTQQQLCSEWEETVGLSLKQLVAKYSTFLDEIDANLLEMDPSAVNSIGIASDLLEWLRFGFSCEADFATSIEIAMSRKEVDCPPELWVAKKENTSGGSSSHGRPDEVVLSKLVAIRRHFRPFVQRISDQWESLEEATQSLVLIPPLTESIKEDLEVCARLKVPLMTLLDNDSEAAAVNKLVAIFSDVSKSPDGSNALWKINVHSSVTLRESSSGKLREWTEQELLDLLSASTLANTATFSLTAKSVIAHFSTQLAASRNVSSALRDLCSNSGYLFVPRIEVSDDFAATVSDSSSQLQSFFDNLEKSAAKWREQLASLRRKHPVLNLFLSRQIHDLFWNLSPRSGLSTQEAIAKVHPMFETSDFVGKFLQVWEKEQLEMKLFKGTEVSSRDILLVVAEDLQSTDTLALDSLQTLCEALASVCDPAKLGSRYFNISPAISQATATTSLEEEEDRPTRVRPAASALTEDDYITDGVQVVIVPPTISPIAFIVNASSFIGMIPELDTMLHCNFATTLEHVSCFLHWWSSNCRIGALFILSNVDCLPFDVQSFLSTRVQDLSSTSSCPLLILTNSASCHAAVALGPFIRSLSLMAEDQTEQLRTSISNQCWSEGVEVVTGPSGSGKSFYVRSYAVMNRMKRLRLRVNREMNEIEVCDLLEQAISTISAATATSLLLLHLDFADTNGAFCQHNESWIASLLFSGVVLDRISGRCVSLPRHKCRLVLEIPKDREWALLKFLPQVEKVADETTFETSEEVLLRGMGQDGNDGLFGDISMFDRLQFCVAELKKHERHGITDPFEVISRAFTVNKGSRPNNFWIIWNFVKMMYRLVREVELQSDALTVTQKQGCIAFSIRTAVVCTQTPPPTKWMVSLDIAGWGEGGNSDFLLFDKRGAPQLVVQGDSENHSGRYSIRGEVINVDDLTDIPSELIDDIIRQSFSSLDKKKKMVGAAAASSKKDSDDKFCLTSDTVLKLAALSLRLRCGLSVVLCGEAGIGKTWLISFLCKKLQVPLVVLDIHGGTTEEEILETFARAEEMVQTTSSTVNIFLDEINTCSHMGLLSEVLCQRTLKGKRISNEIRLLAALNPYVRKAHVEKKSGLVFRMYGDGGSGSTSSSSAAGSAGASLLPPDPMDTLVYRVHPIPSTLKTFVFDFGKLSIPTETQYVQHIVRTGMPEEIPRVQQIAAEFILAAQRYVRRINGISATSLRDVSRVLSLFHWFRSQLVDHIAVQLQGQLLDKTAVAVVLAIAHCYYYRLTPEDRPTLFSSLKWGSGFGSYLPWKPLSQTGAFESVLMQVQSFFAAHVVTDDGIAKNTALVENLFTSIVCILNRIPLFIVGKPGTSKTLTLQIIASNLLGDQSPCEFWRRFPPVHLVQFQCSPLTTAAAILRQFDVAVSYQKHSPTTLVILLLDEVGLAEHSPDMPLKCLHAMLVKPPVAIVGLSNWELDPAKMNRAIVLFRGDPTEQDILQTGVTMAVVAPPPSSGMTRTPSSSSSSSEAISRSLSRSASGGGGEGGGGGEKNVLARWLPHLAHAFRQICQAESSSDSSPTTGMRDFYGLLKQLRLHLATHGNLDLNAILHAVCRNFGGRPQELDQAVSSFLEACRSSSNEDAANIVLPSTKELVDANLSSFSCRHLMILTEDNSLLPLLMKCGVIKEQSSVVLMGNGFRGDASTARLMQQIVQVKNAMAAGQTVVLVNHDNIYEALYDVLNQRYVLRRDDRTGQLTRMLRLAIGTRSQLCPVKESFKIIVTVDANYAYQKLDLPLLNRFEKQVLRADSLIQNNPRQCKFLHKLRDWCAGILEDSGMVTLNNVFMGFDSDATLSSLVLYLTNFSDDFEWGEDSGGLLSQAKRMLAQCATPLALSRCPIELGSWIPKVATQKKNEAGNEETTMVSAVSCLEAALKQFVLAGESTPTTPTVILTSSPSSVLARAVTSMTNGAAEATQVHVLSLGGIDTETTYIARLNSYFSEAASKKQETVVIVQCDPVQTPSELITHARELALREYQRRPVSMVHSSSSSSCHLVFVVHLPPGISTKKRHYPLVFLSPWRYVFVDDLSSSTSESDGVSVSLDALLSESPLSLVQNHGAINLLHLIRSKFITAMVASLPAVPATPIDQDAAISLALSHRVSHLRRLIASTGGNFVPFLSECIVEILSLHGDHIDSQGMHVHVSRCINAAPVGSLRQNLLLSLERCLVEVFSHILKYLDRNGNLQTLSDEGGSSPLWIAMANIERTDMLASFRWQSSAAAAATRKEEKNLAGVDEGDDNQEESASPPTPALLFSDSSVCFAAKFPFSDRILRLFSVETKHVLLSNCSKVDLASIKMLDDILVTTFGSEMVEIWNLGRVSSREEHLAYLHDAMASTAHRYQGVSLQVQSKVAGCIARLWNRQALSTIGGVHAALWANETRLFHTLSLLSCVHNLCNPSAIADKLEETSVSAFSSAGVDSVDATFCDRQVLLCVMESFWSSSLTSCKNGRSSLVQWNSLLCRATSDVDALLLSLDDESSSELRRMWARLSVTRITIEQMLTLEEFERRTDRITSVVQALKVDVNRGLEDIIPQMLVAVPNAISELDCSDKKKLQMFLIRIQHRCFMDVIFPNISGVESERGKASRDSIIADLICIARREQPARLVVVNHSEEEEEEEEHSSISLVSAESQMSALILLYTWSPSSFHTVLENSKESSRVGQQLLSLFENRLCLIPSEHLERELETISIDALCESWSSSSSSPLPLSPVEKLKHLAVAKLAIQFYLQNGQFSQIVQERILRHPDADVARVFALKFLLRSLGPNRLLTFLLKEVRNADSWVNLLKMSKSRDELVGRGKASHSALTSGVAMAAPDHVLFSEFLESLLQTRQSGDFTMLRAVIRQATVGSAGAAAGGGGGAMMTSSWASRAETTLLPRKAQSIIAALVQFVHNEDVSSSDEETNNKEWTDKIAKAMPQLGIPTRFDYVIRWFASGCVLPEELGRGSSGISEIISHACIVGMLVEDSVLASLLFHTSEQLTSFMPTMPDDETTVVIAAMPANLGWYLCPNGHPYSVGECTRPMQDSKCVQCGAPIGGRMHVPHSGNRTVDVNRLLGKDAQKGFVLAATQGQGSNIVNRGVTTLGVVAVRSLRLIMRGLLLVACLHGTSAVSLATISLLLPKAYRPTQNDVVRLLIPAIHEDWETLLEATSLSEYDLTLNLQYLLKLWADNASIIPATFDSVANRARAEDAFQTTVVSPAFSSANSASRRELFFKIGESQVAGQLCGILGVETWSFVKEANIHHAPWGVHTEMLWRFRTPASLHRLQIQFSENGMNADEYPLIDVFLKEEKSLRLATVIIDILEWHAILFRVLSPRHLKREDVAHISNLDVVEMLPEYERPSALEILDRFCEGFNLAFPMVENLYECEINPFLNKKTKRVDLSGTTSSNVEMDRTTPVVFSLPSALPGETDAAGLCTVQLLLHLARSYNKILASVERSRIRLHQLQLRREREKWRQRAVNDGYFWRDAAERYAAEAAAIDDEQYNNNHDDDNGDFDDDDGTVLSYLSPPATLRRMIVPYKRQIHLLRILSLASNQSLQYGQGSNLTLDLDVIQEEITHLFRGLSSVRIHVAFFSFAGDIRKTGRLAALHSRITQEPLPAALVKGLQEEIDTVDGAGQLLLALEDLIRFVVDIVAKSGKVNGETSLSDFVVSSTLMAAADWERVGGRTVSVSAKIKHLQALFLFAEEAVAGSALTRISPAYAAPLPTDLRHQLARAKPHLDAQLVVGILRDFIVDQLQEENWPSSASLKEYITFYTEVDLDSAGNFFREHFPPSLTLAHAAEVLKFLSD